MGAYCRGIFVKKHFDGGELESNLIVFVGGSIFRNRV